MKKLPIQPSAIIFLLLMLSTAFSFSAGHKHAKPGEWWNTPYPDRFDSSQLKNNLSLIRVKGNKLLTEQGETFIFRGVNISDPDKLSKNGKWSKAHFEAIKSFGANVVRVPIHPIAWRERGNKAYFKLLDEAIIWANALKMYVIIDWHSIGNLETGLFQHPMYETTKQETYSFWRQTSYRYKGVSTVAVYEIFNEPTDYSKQLGESNWDAWRKTNEEIITLIYAQDDKVIPLVAGFNWAYDLTPLRTKPIRRKGIAYATHPYPEKTSAPFKKNWERDYGFAAKTYPLIATEIGFMKSTDPGAHPPVVDDEGIYGDLIMSYFDDKGISWTAWCFDPDWPAQLIKDWKYTPTWQGKFFKDAMIKRNKN